MSKKIMIVEEEKVILDLLRYGLEQKGYEVIHAAECDQAEVQIGQLKPDLVISEVSFENADGLKFCKKIKKGKKSLPVLFLSKKNTNADVEKGIKAGADAYLTKPFRLTEVLKAVAVNLEKTRLMDTFGPQRKRYHVHPGEIYVGGPDVLITTVLGSCVSVCLWDERKQIGGMNHVMLPKSPEGEASTRFGNVATFVLLDMMRENGLFPKNLKVWLFGGANGMSRQSGQKSTISIGEKKLEVTRKVLNKLRLDITNEDTGGLHGRKIQFDCITGKIRMNYLKRFDFEQEIVKIEEGM